MSETIVFWFRWLWLAMRTMPSFLGNNWIGAVFACVVVFLYERKSFYSSPEVNASPNLAGKARLLGAFLMDHWRATFKLWLCVLVAFLIGHALDLARRDSDLLAQSNRNMAANLSGEPARQEHATRAIRQDLGVALSDAKQSCAELKGANGVLERQNKDQQGSINNCQTQAIKLLSPEPFHPTTIIFSDSPTSMAGQRIVKLLLLSNKTVTPVRYIGRCNARVTLAEVTILGSETFAGEAALSQTNEVYVNADFPAWTPISPMFITLTYTGDNIHCNFYPR